MKNMNTSNLRKILGLITVQTSLCSFAWQSVLEKSRSESKTLSLSKSSRASKKYCGFKVLLIVIYTLSLNTWKMSSMAVFSWFSQKEQEEGTTSEIYEKK